MNRLSLALVLAAFAPALACGGAPSSSTDSVSTSGALTVHGTYAPTGKTLDNARAIAVGANGRTFASYLDPRGQFTLNLPSGHAYRVVFANSRADGSEVVLGHLMVRTSSGAQEFLGVRRAGEIELGTVSTTAARSAVSIACNCTGSSGGGGYTGGGDTGGDKGGDHGGDKGGDHGGDDGHGGGYSSGGGGDDGGDYGCHENDGEGDGVCKDDGGDDEVYCENDPGDDCDAHDLDDDYGKAECKKKTGKHCDGSDGGGYTTGGGGKGGGGGDGSGSGGSGGGSGSGGSHPYDGGATTPPPPPSPPSPPAGGCTVNAQCGDYEVCCGGACHTHG